MIRQLFVLCSLLVLLGACNWNLEPQYSPEIYGSHFYVNPVFDGDSIVSAKDTVDIFYDMDDDSYDLDTVYVGDTVVFSSVFYSVNSNLLSVRIDWDSTKLALWYTLTDSTKMTLTSQTDLASGDLYFDPGYNRVSFPIAFTPLIKGGLSFCLTVESDSEFPKTSALFYIPAK